MLSGRDPERLAAVADELSGPAATDTEIRPASTDDVDALRRAMDGARAVVACAGPLGRIGELLVRTAIDCRVHYLDIATEQSFLRPIYERYESAARKAGIAVVNGVGCFVGLADFAAHLASASPMTRGGNRPGDEPSGESGGESGDQATADPIDEIAVAYALHRFRASSGLRRSLIDSVLAPGYEWVEDRWDLATPGAEYRSCNFGGERGDQTTVAFPSGEVITIPRHVPVRRVQTYVSVAEAGPLGEWAARLGQLFSPVVSLFLGSGLSSGLGSGLAAQFSSLLDFGPATPSPADRARSRFAITARARRGFADHSVLVTGGDPYAVCASLVSWAALDLLSQDEILAGVRAPSEVFEPRAALAALVREGAIELATSFPMDEDQTEQPRR